MERLFAGMIALMLIAAAPAVAPVPVPSAHGIKLGASGALVRFGIARAMALQQLAPTIGKPVSQRTIPDCGQGTPMSEARFSDGLTLTFMRGKFVGWDLDSGKGPPVRTDRGIGIGATRTAVKRAYPSITVDDGPLGLMFTGDDEDTISGFLSANRPTGKVIGLFAGETCKVS